MKRYSLRNKDKIKDKLGNDILNRIILSLNAYFVAHDDIEVFEGNPYPVIIIDDIEHTTNLISFYVIRQKYDVYNLAFNEFIG